MALYYRIGPWLVPSLVVPTSLVLLTGAEASIRATRLTPQLLARAEAVIE